MLEIRILNGLYQGGALALDEERITLGSSLECDIEVLDHGIKAKHCVIEYIKDRNAWYVQALEGEITIGSENKPVNIIEIQRDLVIRVGTLYVGFFDTEEPWDLDKYSRPNLMQQGDKRRKLLKYDIKVYLGVAAVVGSFLTYSFADDGKSNRGEEKPAFQNGMTQEPANKPTEATAETQAGADIDVKRELKHMLRQRGLQSKVSITSKENQWILTGNLSVDELETISRMVARFNVTYPGIKLVNSTKEPSRVLPFEIRSVSSGMYAHILTTDGQRIYVGDTIQGFTLKKIEKDKIQFSGESDVELLW